MEENLFGQILLSNNFVQKHELERAVEIQQSSKTPKFLGEVLIEVGQLRVLMFGTLILLLFLFLPQGVIPTVRNFIARRRVSQAAASPDSASCF